MDLTKLRDARIDALRVRDELLTEIASLREREKHLAAAIASLELAIGDAPESVIPLTALPAPLPVDQIEQAPEATADERAYWEVAKDLLEEVNRPLTVPEMMAILTPRGHKIQSDGLRVAMIRRSDIFRKNGYGRYALLSWPTSSRNSDLSHFDRDGSSIGGDDEPLTDDPFVAAFTNSEEHRI